MLLNPIRSYAFVTFSCIEKPLRAVHEAIEQVLEPRGARNDFCQEKGRLDLSRIYVDAPPAGGAHPLRLVCYEPLPCPGLTVLFINSEDGWLTLGVRLSTILECECWMFRLTSDHVPWPVRDFHVHSGGVQKRVVSALKDSDGWKFVQLGAPLPCENPSLYRKRRIRDRFTMEYALELAGSLNWPIASDEFWTSNEDAYYFLQSQRRP
jgi:hypothetical protein